MNKLNWKQAWALKCQIQRPADRLPRGIKAVMVQVEGPAEVDLEAINAGHGVVAISNFDPAVFDRFKRIYSEAEMVKVTGNVKTVQL